MMGSGEQGVPICFTTFWAFALRLRTLNEIALPAVPMGTMLSAGADYLMTVAFLLKPERPPATGAMGCSRPKRKPVASIHMRCNMVASLRATAIRAFAMPRRLAIFIPHARKADHFWLRIRSECAAS